MTGKNNTSIRNELIEIAIKNKIPLQAHLELTRLCWLDCVHCYVDHEDSKNELSTKEWISVLEELADCGTFFITFTGGDPFVRRDFFDILEAAHDFGFQISILASWYKVDKQTVERLANFRIRRLSFSFYGVKAETHEAITKRRGSLQKLKEVLSWAIDLNIPVQPKFLIMKHNTQELRPFFEEIVDKIPKQHLVKPIVDFQLFESFSPKRNPTELRLTLNELLELFNDNVVRSRIFPEDLLKDTASAYTRGNANKNDPPCTIGTTSIALDSLGNVYPCEMWPRPLGNVRQHSLRWLWENSDEIKLVRSITVGSLTECQQCELAPHCQACMAYAVLEKGDWRKCSTNAHMLATLMKHLKHSFKLHLPSTDSNSHN